MKSLLFCKACKEYTMKETCPHCNKKTSPVIPPKFSPEDKYAKYRREVLESERKEKGLL